MDKNKCGLAVMQMTLGEIQEEQLRQGEKIQRLARELTQPNGTESRQGCNLSKQASKLKQPDATQRQQDSAIVGQGSRSPGIMQSSATQGQQRNRRRSKAASATCTVPYDFRWTKIVVAGGGSRSYEIFTAELSNKWTLHKDTLFFDHNDAFSFLYDNKVMICGGTDTNRVEYLDLTSKSSDRFASTLPVQLPGTDCGKGVLCGNKILTFGTSVLATSLKPPSKTTVLVPYNEGAKLSSYAVARVNENAVAFVGGYKTKSGETSDSVFTFNLTTKHFKKLAPLPYSVADMAVLVYKDNLVILGGTRSYYTDSLTGTGILKSESLNGVLMYNITNQRCRKLPSMLEKRSKCAALIKGDTVIAMGGNTEESPVNLKTAEYLVLRENKWKQFPAMHICRAGAICVHFERE